MVLNNEDEGKRHVRFIDFWHHLRLRDQNRHPLRRFYASSPVVAEFLLISTVTFCFFTCESIIHYNIGKNGGLGKGFVFPSGKELGSLLGTMVAFSLGSTLTISGMKQW